MKRKGKKIAKKHIPIFDLPEKDRPIDKMCQQCVNTCISWTPVVYCPKFKKKAEDGGQ